MSEAPRLLRFVATGALNTGFGYAIYACLVATGLPLWMAVVGTTTLAMLFNFLSYGRLVFGDTRLTLLPRFLIFYLVLGALNVALLRALSGLGVGPLFAQALLLPILAGIGYFGMRRFVFRTPTPVVAA